MIKQLLFLILSAAMGSGLNAQSTVIVSEYVDACSGNDPKALELWNPSAVDIDMSVTNILVEVQTNSNTSWTTTTELTSGILAAGEVLVISDANVGINSSTCATKITKNLDHNGDDAYRITLGATVTDIFGDPSGVDPGSGWSGGPYSASRGQYPQAWLF